MSSGIYLSYDNKRLLVRSLTILGLSADQVYDDFFYDLISKPYCSRICSKILSMSLQDREIYITEPKVRRPMSKLLPGTVERDFWTTLSNIVELEFYHLYRENFMKISIRPMLY